MDTNKKYAAVTFLFGDYDLLREPLIVDENIDYYCLTDNKNLKSDNWICVYIEQADNPLLNGRQRTNMVKESFYKYIPNSYEYFICMDTSIEIADRLSEVLDYFKKNDLDIGLSIHGERDRYIDEYKEWERTRKLNKKYIEYFKKYCEDNNVDYTEKTGLIEFTVKIYKNTRLVLDFIDEIYNTLEKYTNFGGNDQCYVTSIFRKYDDKMKSAFFYRQLYSNSKYFNSYLHKSNKRWINKVVKQKTKKMLFGKDRNLVEFGVDGIDIFIGTQKTFEPKVTNEAYKIIVGNHNIENKSNLELIQCKHDSKLDDSFYSEIYMLDYIAKNYGLKKYVGFCHNRRYFNFLDNIPNLDEIFSEFDCVTAKPKQFKGNIIAQYKLCHNIEDLYIIGGIIADKYPQYAKMWHTFINGKIFIPYNMFIMKSEDFIEYMKFIMGVLDEYVKIVGTDINKRIEDNKDKYLKSFYPNNTQEYQYRIGGYLGERCTNLFLLTHFKKIKTYSVIVTEDKYKKEKEQSSL